MDLSLFIVFESLATTTCKTYLKTTPNPAPLKSGAQSLLLEEPETFRQLK